MTAVSVLIPAYNAAATLTRALDSVADQGHELLEVIVVDDCSRDDTAAVAEAYARLPVRVIRHGINRGASGALNTALEAASHELVAFLDADDEWLPGKLAAQLAYLDAHPDTILIATGFGCFRGGDLVYSYGLEPFPYARDEFWRLLLRDAAIKKSSVLTQRRLVLSIGGFNTQLKVAEDQDLFLRLAALGPVGYVHELLVKYHDTPGSLTKQATSHDLTHVLPMIERHVAAFASRMTAAQRRAVLGRRYARAAGNLLDGGAWRPGLRLWARAVACGEFNTLHLAIKLPPVRALKDWIRRR